MEDEADCPAEVKPEAEEECSGKEESCLVVDWVVSDWSSCKDNCGTCPVSYCMQAERKEKQVI